jgi:hypothetical protein
VSLDYQVEDSARMVDQPVEDTESLAASALEDLLRPVSRRFTLDQHHLLLQELESVLQADFLMAYGLRKIRCHADLRSDTSFEERVQQLKDLELPQSRTREVRLPSNLPGLFFHAKASLTYHVVDRAKLPSEILSKVEEQLWPQVEARLWSLSRPFKIGQEAEVEQAIHDGIIKGKPQGYGLEIQSISVTIEPDKSTSTYQQRHIQVNRDRVLTQIQDQALAEQKQRQRELTREELVLYRAIVRDGELLAFKLAQNPALVDEVIEHLSAQDREQFRRDVIKIQLLMEQSEQGDKGLFDDERRKLSQAILNSVSKNFKSLSSMAGLLADESFPVLSEPDEMIQGIGAPASASGTGAPGASGGASTNGHQQQTAGTPAGANGAAAPSTPPASSGDAKGLEASTPAGANGVATPAKPAAGSGDAGEEGLQQQVGGPVIKP